MPQFARDAGLPGRMPRLHVAGDLDPEAPLALDQSQVNYLRNVMRLGAGSEFLAFNGRDGEWLMTLAELDRKKGSARAVERTRPQAPAPGLRYCFAPLKHARLDYMVQKATEMGAGVLQPVLTRRTVVARVNGARMAANAIEAAEQCNLLTIPEIAAVVTFDRLLEDWPAATPLVYCDEAAPIASPLEALGGLTPGPVGVLVGPEGGFTPEERASLRRRDFVVPIALGPRIMRADTAAVAAMAVVQAVVGDWRPID
jgi:16S rRNA (uracil1498-N3)-methyltransferase